jgi:glycyl-tRNA synthetase
MSKDKAKQADAKETANTLTLEKLTQFAKRKGFVFPSSEIYGGFQAVYDYGHYGILLKNNIQKSWWETMVKTENVVGLDSGIFMHPMTWKASGHLDSFVEPAVDCKTCKTRMKVDDLLDPHGILDADRMKLDEVNEHVSRLLEEGKLQCTKCGGKDLTEAKVFDMLIKSNIGSPTSSLKDLKDEDVVYMRGETCQGIYLNYKNYMQNMRVKLPFGIAQVGKAFRNEIVARQFIFRTREFEQMEFQMFMHPSEVDASYEEWKEKRTQWHIDKLGFKKENLKITEHAKLAHYASKAHDINYKFRSMGDKFAELEGIHARGDWDLSQHQEFSKEKMEYFDQDRNERYIPNIVETAAGLNRLVMAVLDQAYTEEEINGETRIVLKIKPSLAPIKAAIFPLTKDEKLVEIAKEINKELLEDYFTEYDQSGSIGKRYRRQDEIGTPFCITVDFESLDDKMVTIRDRDTLVQVRIAIDKVKKHIQENI